MAAKSKQSIATRTTWVFRGIIWHDTIHVAGKPQSLGNQMDVEVWKVHSRITNMRI